MLNPSDGMNHNVPWIGVMESLTRKGVGVGFALRITAPMPFLNKASFVTGAGIVGISGFACSSAAKAAAHVQRKTNVHWMLMVSPSECYPGNRDCFLLFAFMENDCFKYGEFRIGRLPGIGGEPGFA